MGAEQEMLKYAVQVGGPMAALFLVGGYFYRRDMIINSNEWKEQASILVQIVKENTAAITRNTEVVQSLHRHMFEGERRQP